MNPATLIFLPGAGGDPAFWQPVADALAQHPALAQSPQHRLGWPGFAGLPADPSVHGLDDLAARVVQLIDTSPQACALIAQSMGGVIAVLAALARPAKISHMVLTATSGGIPMAEHQAEDWRPAFFAAHPTLPRWFGDDRRDLRPQLRHLHIPTLLLWGDADPISPISVGQQLAATLPQAQLLIQPGGAHDLAKTHAMQLAVPIARHLLTTHGHPQHGS